MHDRACYAPGIWREWRGTRCERIVDLFVLLGREDTVVAVTRPNGTMNERTRRPMPRGLGSAAAWPFAARAQQGDRVRHIGVLMPFGENDPDGKRMYSAFTQAPVDLGWTDGGNARWSAK